MTLSMTVSFRRLLIDAGCMKRHLRKEARGYPPDMRPIAIRDRVCKPKATYLEYGEDFVSLATPEDNIVTWLETLAEYASFASINSLGLRPRKVQTFTYRRLH